MTKHHSAAAQHMLAIMSILAATSVVHANSQFTTEAVNAYPNCGSLSHRISNAAGFRTRLNSIAGFTGGNVFTDGSVWPSDFSDPDVPPFSGDDTHNFDNPFMAISFFSGHGVCDDQTISPSPCTTSAACPTIAGLDAVCTRSFEVPMVSGFCEYSTDRSLVTEQAGSGSCQFNNISNGAMRFGESNTAGAWAGASVNGNINMAVLDISCGVTPDMIVEEYSNIFAGVSVVSTIMPTNTQADTWDSSDRGSSFGAYYITNQNSSAGASWAYAASTTTGGGACQFGGGGHGISGCGANISISQDIDQPSAEYNLLTKSWISMRDETQDVQGSGWITYIYYCNYNCAAHPWRL